MSMLLVGGEARLRRRAVCGRMPRVALNRKSPRKEGILRLVLRPNVLAAGAFEHTDYFAIFGIQQPQSQRRLCAATAAPW